MGTRDVLGFSPTREHLPSITTQHQRLLLPQTSPASPSSSRLGCGENITDKPQPSLSSTVITEWGLKTLGQREWLVCRASAAPTTGRHPSVDTLRIAFSFLFCYLKMKGRKLRLFHVLVAANELIIKKKKSKNFPSLNKTSFQAGRISCTHC